jgi:hypothetical protein
MIERHERGHSNSKIGRDVGMRESTGRNIVKHAGKVASAFVVTLRETERRSTV